MDSHGLYDRIDHGYIGHPWASRDYADIDCSAIGCEYHLAGKCLVPSKATIGNEGRCLGFKAKLATNPPGPTCREFAYAIGHDQAKAIGIPLSDMPLAELRARKDKP